MKTNFKKLLAAVLAMLMVVSVFSTLATAVDPAKCDHQWKYISTVAPTCTEAGYDWYLCTICNKYDIKNALPKTGHTPGEWEVTTEPGCSHHDGQEGERVQKCTVCNEVIDSATIPALDHKFVKVWDENAVCGEYTLVYWECQNHLVDGTICGEIKDYSDEVKTHNYANYAVKQEPTCQEYGIMRYTCTDCDSYVDVKINKLDCAAQGNHEMVSETAATCQTTGSQLWKCNVCKDEEGNNLTWTVELPVNPDAHNLSEANSCTEDRHCQNKGCDYVEKGAGQHVAATMTDSKAATCTETGYKTYTCTCGDTWTETLPALGHGYMNGFVKVEATCTTPGEICKLCLRCGHETAHQNTRPLGHDYVATEHSTTCVGDGYTEYVCSRCDDSYIEEGDDAFGHKPPMTKDANGNDILDNSKITWTHDVRGEGALDNVCLAAYTCTVCNQPVTGDERFHREGLTVQILIEATCTTFGTSFDFCKYCGYASSTYDVPPMNHQGFEETVPGKAATCGEDGYTDGVKCSHCNEWITEPEVISKDTVPHGPYFLPIIVTDTYYDADGNELVFKKPTCEEDGSWWKKCQDCGTWVDATTTYNPGKWEALGHDYEEDDGDCTTPVLCTRCGKVGVEAKDAHTPNTDSTDCTVEVHCTECDVVIRAAKDHNPGPVATCKADQICLDCGAVLVESSPNYHPQDGTTSGIAVTTFATCTSGAAGTLFCHLCAVQDMPVSWKEIVKEIDADALASMTDAEIAEATGYAEWIIALLKPEGHNLVQVSAQVPTCQVAGWNAYEYCTKGCGYTTYAPLDADPDNHSALGYHREGVLAYKDGAVVVDENGVAMRWARTPSCYADGLVWYYCDDCAAADATGTYNGWTKTVIGSIMNCHDNIADYGEELTDRETPSTCYSAGMKYYKCTHTYETCDSVKTPVVDGQGVITGYTFEYRRNTYTCEQIIGVASGLADHTFGIVNGVTFPTCEAGATVDAKCVYCDYQFTLAEFNAYTGMNLSADPLGHSYTSVVIDPTCTEVGYTLYTCSVCGDAYTEDEVDALGHSYDTVVTDPTCTDAGYTTYTCSVCGDGYIDDEVAALGHEYDSVVVAPTCTKDGCTEYTCSVCGDFYSDTVVDALGHDYVVAVTPATCTMDGAEIYTCQRADCDHGIDADGHGFGYVVILPALGHDTVSHDAQAPDCENIGWDAYETCTRCDYSTYVEKAALGHLPFDLTDDSAYQCLDHMKAPTCTEVGLGWGAYCQRGYEDENTRHCAEAHVEIPALGHKMETDDIAVGCENYGFTYTICRACGVEGHGYDEAGTEVPGIIMNYVPALGHDRVDGAVEPDCLNPGATGDVCSRCGYKHENYEEIPALGHDIPDHNKVVIETETVECGRCHEMVDAHENHYLLEEDLLRYEEYVEEFEDYSVSYCRKYIYDLKQCVDCGYKWPNITYVHTYREHRWQVLEKVEATVTTPGYETKQCLDCGKVTTEKTAAIKDKIVVDFSVGTLYDGKYVQYTEDAEGNALTGATVNGNKLVLAVDLTAQNVKMASVMIKVAYESEYLEFNYELSDAINNDNGYTDSFLDVVPEEGKQGESYVKAVSTSTTGNVKITPEGVTYLYLVFDVKATAYVDAEQFIETNFELVATDAVNADKDPVTVDTEAEVTAKIYMNGDLSGNGLIGLDDVQYMMDVLTAREYDVQADINCDGFVTMADFGRLQQMLLNVGVDPFAYVEIIEGTYTID
ncbi:MAG: hypothetical protein IJW00_02705 [Clostridia bacterium]|nr:hypothetical protein [Clostridia bacterium]